MKTVLKLLVLSSIFLSTNAVAREVIHHTAHETNATVVATPRAAAAPKVAVTDPNANERIVVKNNGEVEETKTVTRVRR